MSSKPREFSIWPQHEIFYIESMLTITKAAIVDQDMLRTIIKDISDGNLEHIELVIDLVNNIIKNAAAISRFFWPSTKIHPYKGRAKKLRESFNMHETNPLRSTHVRDFIEHFDEKLDDYLQTGISGEIIPSYVGLRIPKDNPPRHLFRAFFVDDWTFCSLGLEYKMVPIINELIRIHNLLLEYKENGGRLPRK